MVHLNFRSNRRGHSLAPIACLLMMPLLGACVATKQDVRVLRNDIAALQAHQDSLNDLSLRNLGAQADSVRLLSDALRSARGQLSNQIRQLQDMLITIQELMGTNAQTVRQLREQLERQQTASQPPPVPPAQGVDAEGLYAAGRTKLEEKSPAAARAAFEQLLSQYPQHERAADAQLGLAEAYVLSEDLSEAVKQFERVAAAYPTSPRAPEALYRAGEISEQLDRIADARRFYELIRTRYSSSPSASLAKRRLANLPKS